MKKKKQFRYRDKRTGRFVSKAKYKRSRAHGGTRYVRNPVKPILRKKPVRKRPPRAVDVGYLITFEYVEKKVKSQVVKPDIIVGGPRGMDVESKETKNFLLNKAENELPETFRWVIILARRSKTTISESNEPAPKEALIRTTEPDARQINFEGEDSEEE